MTESQHQVFISYVEEDSTEAEALANGLEKEGIVTWYYGRDSLPGTAYLTQVLENINKAQIVMVIISKDSLSSAQVYNEITYAHENHKSFMPILKNMNHLEFQTKKPDWRMILGAYTSICIPNIGIDPILGKIIKGTRALLNQDSTNTNSRSNEKINATSNSPQKDVQIYTNQSNGVQDTGVVPQKISPKQHEIKHQPGEIKIRKRSLLLGLIILIGIIFTYIAISPYISWTFSPNPVPEKASIVFTQIPALGTADLLKGQVNNMSPAEYSTHKIGIYIYIPSDTSANGWWGPKPFATETVLIHPDGTWEANIATGGYDINAVKIAAILVPSSVSFPYLTGVELFPPVELENYPITYANR